MEAATATWCRSGNSTPAFLSIKKGRAICIAAGNEGQKLIHAEVNFEGEKTKGELEWEAARGGKLFLYYNTPSREDLRFDSGKDTKVVQRISTYVHPLTGLAQSVVLVNSGGKLTLSSTGKPVKADAYINPSDGKFLGGCARRGTQIATPGTTPHALTVGSYDWNSDFNGKPWPVENRALRIVPMTIGALSAYSNSGPLRRGKEHEPKPEIVAPGQYFTATLAQNANVPNYVRHASGKYRLFNGTSAATPYCAGVVALLMQEKPAITLGEIKHLFKAHATQDRYTGKLPSPEWGYGKLDKGAVVKMIKALRAKKTGKE